MTGRAVIRPETSEFARVAVPHSGPLLAVVIPVYKHSVLLEEAVISALNQQAGFEICIVMVNDGCPMAETHQACLDFVAAMPSRVHYISRANGGLSAARNTGIEYVLGAWETVRAIYFLDADNRLLPGALQRAYDALAGDPEAAWIYPDIDMFGQEWNSDYSGEYSVLRHLDENICEAGSLVRREVFEKGARFDESMRLGFEDWDFWLTAVELGFRGKHISNLGFLYRKRPESMVRDSERDRSDIISYLRRKHIGLFRFDAVMTLEHTEAPRYGIYNGDTGLVSVTSDPTVEGRLLVLEEFFNEYYRAKSAPMRYSRPAFVVVTGTPIQDRLRELRLLHWIFWYLESLTASHNLVLLVVGNDAAQNHIGVKNVTNIMNSRLYETAALTMVGIQLLDKCLDHSEKNSIALDLAIDIVQKDACMLELSLPDNGDQPQLGQANASLRELFQKMRDFRSGTYQGVPWIWRESSLRPRSTLFEVTRDVLKTGPVYPRLRKNQKKQVGFLVPMAGFGGVEKTAYSLATLMRRRGWSTHLFIFHKQWAKPVDEIVDAFDSMSFVCDPGVGNWDRQNRFMGSQYPSWVSSGHHERALGLLSGLDAVVNCHCAEAHALMAPLRRQGTTTVAALQATDLSAFERPAGHTYLTLGYEHAYDVITCCSQQLFDWCHAMGVPEAKLSLVLNAPSYRLPAQVVEDVMRKRLAREKGPLRVMYLGRLGRQKGLDRLSATIIMTRQTGLPIDWRLIGTTVIDGTFPQELKELAVEIEPPKLTPVELTECYNWADILLIVSRWEGLPLTILEAMRLGVVVCATAVGAVAEAISHNQTGFVLPSTGTGAIAGKATKILQALCEDRNMLHRVSLAAAEAMKDREWETTASDFLSRLDQKG